MRILFLNHNYRYMATFNRGRGMAEHLARRGHDVTLLTVSREHRYRPTWSMANGVRLGEMPNFGQNASGEGYGPIDNLLRCAHALAHRYDIIHMLDHKPNATFGGFAGRVRGARLIADWVDWWGGPTGINDVPQRRFPIVGKFENWWEIKTKLAADGVVTISTVLYQRAIDIGCDRSHVLWIPNGSEVETVRSIPVCEARQHLNVPMGRLIIGFLGMSQGDMEIVMGALQHLPTVANREVWLMVIGPKNPRVLEQAQRAGVADRVWQTGFVLEEQMGLYLSCADVMCIPLADTAANRGRLAGKLMYYMAAGRPTVVSPIGDTASIVDKYKTGIVADSCEFEGAIRKLLNDDALRDEFGRNARKTAEDVFAWDHLIVKLEAFYRRIVARSTIPSAGS